jgi:hypothetical protein
MLTTTLQCKGGYSLQRCNVQRNGCCNHVWRIRSPNLNPNSSCSAVFIVKTCNHAVRAMWLQQPLRCTLQSCSEYPPLHCSVVMNTRPYIAPRALDNTSTTMRCKVHRTILLITDSEISSLNLNTWILILSTFRSYMSPLSSRSKSNRSNPVSSALLIICFLLVPFLT